MRLLRLSLACLALLAVAHTCLADERIALAVLYAGNPGGDRAQDYTRFLQKHFNRVGTADYSKFTADQAKGYDVVVLDWGPIYPRDQDGKIPNKIESLNLPKAPVLSEEYSRSTLMIGAVAGTIGKALRLKIDWR
jgi:hypothetical protein